MSFTSQGKPREYLRRVTYTCTTCRNAKMGVVYDHEGSVTLECPKCDASAHVFTHQLLLEDQGTPQAAALLARIQQIHAQVEAEAEVQEREQENQLTKTDLEKLFS